MLTYYVYITRKFLGGPFACKEDVKLLLFFCFTKLPTTESADSNLRRSRQVCFIVSFFVMEARSQTSTALGFAVLNVRDDVRLVDGVAELSADVISPRGTPLEGVVCVVDLKVMQCHIEP